MGNSKDKPEGLQKVGSKKIGHLKIDDEGQLFLKKTSSDDLMRGIQLGLHQALGSLTRIPEHDVLITDFDEVVTCDFPRVGSATTPAHNTPDFTFTSIAPKAFRYFRNYYKIDILDFMVSLCDKPLKELSNPGASGSLFYVTDDDQYIVKTLENKEAVFLRKLLPGYFLNMTQSQATLLPKFFGLFIYGTNLGRNIRLIIMNNLLPREIPLHEKFDLKGSLSGRFASKKELSKASPTLKDLDFLKVHSSGIALSKETFLLVKTTISSDCRVLRSFKIMDYSLLVGIHQISKETFTQLSHVGSGSEPETLSQGIIGFDENGESFLIFLGIIDILQRFKLKKKFEYGLKSAVHDKDSISVCPPKKYSQRFLNFVLKRVFHELDSQQHNALVRKLNIIRSFSRISSTQVSKKKPRDEVRAEETGNNNEDSLSKRRLSF